MCGTLFVFAPMHPIFKCVLPGRFFSKEAVPYIWYILPLMLIYSIVDKQ